MKQIYLETFGCQMNVLDSELVENQLRMLGYTFTPSIEEADVVLYNTCSVRERSEQKVWSRLGRMKQRKVEDPTLVVGVIGCMAERDGVGLMKRMPHVDLMCGPSELDQLPALLDNVLKTGKQQHALAGNTSRRSKTLDHALESGVESHDQAGGLHPPGANHAENESDGLEHLDLSRSFTPKNTGENRYQAYIRIVRGCNKFCTYCVVPYTRGAEVSRSPQAILQEAQKLVDAGCLEITLLGQTVNHYVYEHDTAASTSTGPAPRRTTFAELLQLLHDHIPALPRLRFLTSFPADFGDDILHVMAQSPRICPYLHVPAQSGSNRILKAMNRGYTAEKYLDLLDRARRIVPGIALAGDFIVGFPTETDEDYAQTRELVEKARYKNCFIFKYSPRPGTVAIKRHPDDVPEEVKRFRNNDLLHVQNRICNELNRELIGQTVQVLCDGPSGWGGEQDSKMPDSIVAGASSHHCDSATGRVELGARLAAGLRKTGNLDKRSSGISGHPEHRNSDNPCESSSQNVTNESDSRTISHEHKHDAPAVLDRHGQPYRRPSLGRNQPGWVQLAGRTNHDQIVVFQGPREAAGRLLPVTVREAHGMTIFGDWAQSPAEAAADLATV